MHEAEGVNFKVGLMKEESSGPKDIRKFSRKGSGPNLDEVMVFIKSLGIPQTDKELLVRQAKKIPHGALGAFCRNHMKYLKNSN